MRVRVKEGKQALDSLLVLANHAREWFNLYPDSDELVVDEIPPLSDERPVHVNNCFAPAGPTEAQTRLFKQLAVTAILLERAFGAPPRA